MPIVRIDRRGIFRAAAGALLASTPVAALLQGAGIAHAAPMPGTTEDFRSIKILAFDFQGSCMDYHQPIAGMGQEINKNKGLSLDWSILTKEWINHLYRAVAEHRNDYLPAAQLYRVALDRMLAQQQLSATFSNEERDQIMGVWDRMAPWPDTAEGLSRLKRKFALTTLSNASMASVFQSVRRHALPFDQVLTGELVRAYKPAPQVYNLVTSLLGYQTDEVLFCATHFSDLKEAKKFGYKTAWWPRPNETGPGQVTDTVPKPFVDIHARDITDLAQQLGA